MVTGGHTQSSDADYNHNDTSDSALSCVQGLNLRSEPISTQLSDDTIALPALSCARVVTPRTHIVIFTDCKETVTALFSVLQGNWDDYQVFSTSNLFTVGPEICLGHLCDTTIVVWIDLPRRKFDANALRETLRIVTLHETPCVFVGTHFKAQRASKGIAFKDTMRRCTRVRHCVCSAGIPKHYKLEIATKFIPDEFLSHRYCSHKCS